MLITTILSLLLAIGFVLGGVAALLRLPPFPENARRVGMSTGLGVFVALAEIAAGLAVAAAAFVPAARPLGVAAATGLVLLMIGALVFHRRAHDPAGQYVPAAALGVVAAAVAALLATA